MKVYIQYIKDINAYVIAIKGNRNIIQWICTINQKNKIIAMGKTPACRYLALMFRDRKIIDLRG